MSTRYVEDNMYIDPADVSSQMQHDSYFASILPSNKAQIEISKEELKARIQSMNKEDLKETIFQFLQSEANLPAKFIGFIERNQPTKGIHSSKENWNTIEGFQGRNWSAEYVALLSENAVNSKPWQIKMYRLSNDFFHAASLYAQVIISELSLPIGLKSIQPVNIGGVAGGQKFIIDNILFKFAVDSFLGTEKKPVYMYGGAEQRNDLAMKAASIEMRNMQTILASQTEKLFVPLACVIDYQGHRIIASSIIPIDKYTICYGSADGGRTVYRSRTELNEMIEKLGEKLNLQEHRTGSRSGGRSLFMPGDIEIHEGMDGRYYVIDVARLMPPEAPTSTSANEDCRKIYYQTLRPEFVLGYKYPLNSDAFTAWNDFEPNKEQHEKTLREATHYLRNTLIPNFAAALQRHQLEAVAYIPENREAAIRIPGDQLITLLDSADISAVVHYYGINVRHLGLIRHYTTVPKFRDFLLIQCVTRAIKNIMREDMRKIMTFNLGSPSDMPLRDLVLSTYRKIHPYCCIIKTEEQREEINAYWNLVFEKTCAQFESCFNQEEIIEISDSGLHAFVNKRVDFRAVLYLCFQLAQVQLSEDAIQQLMYPVVKDDVCMRQEFRLVRADVEQFRPRIRKPFISSFASSLLLAKEAKAKSLASQNARRLMNLALEQMKAAQQAAPSSEMLNCYLGFMFWDTSKLIVDSNPTKRLVPLFWAVRHLEMAVSVSDHNEWTYKKFEELLNETEEYCVKHQLCLAYLNTVRSRNHSGVASCPRKRLQTGDLPPFASRDSLPVSEAK